MVSSELSFFLSLGREWTTLELPLKTPTPTLKQFCLFSALIFLSGELWVVVWPNKLLPQNWLEQDYIEEHYTVQGLACQLMLLITKRRAVSTSLCMWLCCVNRIKLIKSKIKYFIVALLVPFCKEEKNPTTLNAEWTYIRN